MAALYHTNKRLGTSFLILALNIIGRPPFPITQGVIHQIRLTKHRFFGPLPLCPTLPVVWKINTPPSSVDGRPDRIARIKRPKRKLFCDKYALGRGSGVSDFDRDFETQKKLCLWTSGPPVRGRPYWFTPLPLLTVRL